MPGQDIVRRDSFLRVDGRYVCADNLRFTCILAIIAVHASGLLTAGTEPGSTVELFQLAAVTVLKFGTIGFFLISGFLLEKNLRTRSSLDLMRRRLSKVFLPWIFWFIFTCAALSLSDFVHHRRAFLVGSPLVDALWKTVAYTFTRSAFWFVPNLLLSLMVLLIFRRYLQSIWFGALLLAASLFYSLNIYTQWIDAHHTRAFFGFIFYLWLGHYIAANLQRFSELLRSISAGSLGLATFAAGMAAIGEGFLLMHLHSADPQNTLRVTTQVFSVLVFLCFFKYQRRIWPNFFDVPHTTFGMYLSHVVLLASFTSPLRTLMRSADSPAFLGSFTARVLLWLVATALTVGASFAVARALSASSALSWIVGSNRRAARPQESEAEAAKVAIVA